MTIFTSIFWAKVMDSVGRRNTNAFSQVAYIFHYAILVYLDYENETSRFFWLSILTAILGAMGSGANSASTMAIMSSLDDENRERNIGIMEATFGLGMLLGPLVGGFMFSAFGFKGMFFIFVLIGCIMLPWTYLLLGGIKNSELQQKDESISKEEVDLRALLTKPRFTFGLIS